MPAGAIHDEHTMTALGYLFTNRFDVAFHGRLVDTGQYQPHRLFSRGAHGSIQIGILKLLPASGAWASAFFRPLTGQTALLAHTGFILKPYIDLLGPDPFGQMVQ